MRRALRVLALVATSGLAVCGVKGSPRPPEAVQVETVQALDAGAASDAGAGAASDAGPTAGVGAGAAADAGLAP